MTRLPIGVDKCLEFILDSVRETISYVLIFAKFFKTLHKNLEFSLV